MVYQAKLIRLATTSGVAIAAVLAFAPTEANSCTFSQTGTPPVITSITVNCRPGDVAAAFATSFTSVEPTFRYDGNGGDTFNMIGGQIVRGDGVINPGSFLDERVDRVEMLGGNDTVTVTSGAVGQAAATVSIYLGEGADTFTMSGGTVFGDVHGGDFATSIDDGDNFSVGGGSITGLLAGDAGNDTISVSGGSVGLSVEGGAGSDQIFILGGTVGGAVFGGAGNDTLTLDGGSVAGNLSGDDGDDRITVSSGSVGANVNGGAGVDNVLVSGGSVGDNVSGDEGDDQVTISGGTVGGSVTGGGGVDSVVVSGGRIAGNVEGESITLSGGSIGGDISGISGNTLTINGSATPLDLRNGVVISGTNAVGVITNEDLGLGGSRTQFFTGFNSLTLDQSSIGFGTGNNGIGLLSLTNGSTLFVRGNANMPGTLNLSGSAINMIDGAADDVLTLGGIVINNGLIGVDLNQQTFQADQVVAGTFAATGANTILVNLLGTPEFAGATDIPIVLTGTPVAPGTFVVQGVPGTPASLFTYEVVAGSDGGLFIRASPGNFGIAVATQSAVDVGTVDVAVDTLYDINDDAIAADLGLTGGKPMVPLSDSFGVFATGQWAHVEHDGFTITNSNIVGAGPAFDADDFSAAISFDFNAAKHFGFDDRYGLNIGVFAGYASTDIGLGSFQGFDRVGDADNSSGMFGGYGLFRQGQDYLLVSMSGFLGETDITNDILNSTGSYDTKGFVATGSFGHIFNVTERVRFDLRGGLLAVDFKGGDYVDSGGNQFGESQISFGAFKIEPGVYADYQLDNGMIISPYARADLQQRFGYTNTAIIDTRKIQFDDADFSAALSAGFNLKMNQRSTMSAEIRGKASDDSSAFGGKLGLKVAF